MMGPEARPRVLRVIAARLRFLVVFGVTFAVIGGWETIRTHWARLTTGRSAEPAVSPDTEFFCPMDPGVLSDWPSKCPVCNMTLVRRKRGEPAPLREGVMARMQLTPYRLQLGGIRTAAVDYAPLAKSIELPGLVVASEEGSLRVEAGAFARELAWIEAGQGAEVVPIEGRDVVPAPGRVGDRPEGVGAGGLGRVVVAFEGGAERFRPGDRVRVRVECPVDRAEPFRGEPTAAPPLVPGEPRRLFACMDHPEIVRESDGRCPEDGQALTPRPLRGDQRVRWWCPMHPGVAADRPGSRCDACGGMALVPRVVSFRPPGKVLAIPGSAAIDDGSRSVVFVERGAGMFDARAVTLGPRCGAWFPVVSGLEPGERVVAQGAFLLDAETRLDPGLAAGYFGAGEVAPSSSRPEPRTSGDPAWLTGLSQADRPRALAQKSCPVTGKPLGSMGVPAKVGIGGRNVFLCCDGCSGAVAADPAKYLARLPAEGLRP